MQLREELYSLRYDLQMESMLAKVSNLRHFDLARRVAAYAVSSFLASLIYIVWLAVSATFGEGNHLGLGFGLWFALLFLFAGGFALALILMTVPWAIAVWVQLKTGLDGRIYFPAVGVLLVFVLGCTAAAIVPKPFFIDDQTFLEAAVITAQRQGVCLLLCGIAFGACYCWLERKIQARP
jgi:hypothetical protein